MDEQVVDLGIKFMRGYEPAPTPEPVPGGGTDVAGSLAQTGDLSTALIVGLVLLALAIAGVVAYAFVKNKQFASVVAGVFAKNKQLASIASCVTAKKQHFAVVLSNVAKSFKSLNFANFSLRTKIISAVVTILAIVCIICGCFSMNAHAADGEGPITVSPNTISAVVSEKGQISSWDPASATLTNTSATDKFDFKSIKVALTDEAKSLEALADATIKITGFGGKVVFEGKASDSEVTCTGLSLDKSALTTLAFEITDTFDISQLESLYDKQLFKISLNAEKSFPEHDYLYQYTLSELQQVSNYLAENYTETSTDPVCVKFRAFRDNGILTGDKAGTDNGVPIYSDFTTKTLNENAKNHWAIDSEGRIATDPSFENNSNDTIQVRIIGICEDYADENHSQKIGLTFMTTHVLSAKSKYESDGTAKYGWSGDGNDSSTSSCTLRAKLAGGSLFPQKIKDVVKTAAKGYQYSSDASSGHNTAYDKFWAPSMIEMYGESSSGFWPNDNEGSQYKAFLNKISESSYGSFKNIDNYQSGVGRAGFVWSRSLNFGYAYGACGVSGGGGGGPSGGSVSHGDGVVACFCI